MSRKNATWRFWSIVGLAMTGIALQTPATVTQEVTAYTWETLDPPGSTLTIATAINPEGHIVSRWDGPDGKRRGFLLRDRMYFSTEPPGATFTNANGINPRGDISGNYRDGAGKQHGWLLQDGVS